MEYKIVYGCGIDSIVESVNNWIEMGWAIQGGICVDGIHYYQAMARSK